MAEEASYPHSQAPVAKNSKSWKKISTTGMPTLKIEQNSQNFSNDQANNMDNFNLKAATLIPNPTQFLIPQPQQQSHNPISSSLSSSPSPFDFSFRSLSLGGSNFLKSSLDSDMNGNTVLHLAAMEGQLDQVKSLIIEFPYELNRQNNAGETALFLSCARGHQQIVDFLLQKGANPNISNLEGACPCHIAAAMGYSQILQLLVGRGAFVNVLDDEGDSPLHYAVRESQLEAVVYLVRFCKIDLTLKNEDQESALQLAMCLNEVEITKFLSEAMILHARNLASQKPSTSASLQCMNAHKEMEMTF
jgi:hypothetical protein